MVRLSSSQRFVRLALLLLQRSSRHRFSYLRKQMQSFSLNHVIHLVLQVNQKGKYIPLAIDGLHRSFALLVFPQQPMLVRV